jgi:hypothetical protein
MALKFKRFFKQICQIKAKLNAKNAELAQRMGVTYLRQLKR